jgi:tagatose 6-phosphate kinase
VILCAALNAALDVTYAVEGVRRHAGNRVVSVAERAGGKGIASTPEHRWAARPPARLSGNPTGAGDACVAGLARTFISGDSWPERLAEAVALSAAAVLRPVAGDIDLDAYRRFRDSVHVEEI